MRIFLTAFLALLPGVASAQGHWTPFGPSGGFVTALVIDSATPAVMYAGVWDGGVFRTADGGATWAAVNTGLTDLQIVRLVIDPLTPTTIYAGTYVAGLFRSTNAGGSWTPINTGFPSLWINGLAVHPTTPSTLYAAHQDGGMFRSTNSGDTWTATNAGLTNLEMFSVAIHPSLPSTIFAGSIRTHLFRSTDGADNWEQILDSNTRYLAEVFVFDPQTPSRIYVGANGGFGYGGLYRSLDGGTTWTQVRSLSAVGALVIDPLTPMTLYAGDRVNGLMLKSTNGGTTWTTFNNGLTSTDVRALAIHPVTPATVYAGTGAGGVFRTTDAAVSWNAANTGLGAHLVTALAIDPQVPAIRYAGTHLRGVFRSLDGGLTWAAANNGLTDLWIRALVVSPTAPRTIFAGTATGGVFRSTDGGTTWAEANTGLLNLQIWSIAVSPVTSSVVHAATGWGMFRSTDGGDSWTWTAPSGEGGDGLALAIDPLTPSTVYAGANRGVIKSLDNGTTWTRLIAGLPIYDSDPAAVVALAIDPVTPSVLYAGVQRPGTVGFGVYRSNDAGANWFAVNTGLTDLMVTSLAVHPANPSIVYAGTLNTLLIIGAPPWSGSGVFRTTDGGANWTPSGTGLGNPAVGALAIERFSPWTLFAGTMGGSTFRYQPDVPEFGKRAPGDNRVGQPTSVTLKWDGSPAATGFEYCIDTTDNDVCNSGWTSVGASTSVMITGLLPGTPYYWQVRAAHATGTAEADFGAWWRFDVGVVPGANLILNGNFSSGRQHWLTFATPDDSYMVSSVVDGVFEFSRAAPPPGTLNQAVVFQETGAGLGAFAPLLAQFDLANSSSTRKRVSVLVLEADFSDLSVCTFWLEANAPTRTYVMRTHTTKTWSSATIAFYAATPGGDGGFYRLDNVSLQYVAGGSDDRTECVDPTSPAPPGGADGPTLVVNGDFSGGLAPWGLFGQIQHQVAGGVFEFFRPAGVPAGVVLQPTGAGMSAGEILTATFAFGNSSAVRKRVTAILHANNFSDLAACTFWLQPGQPLSPYTMRTFTTSAWTNATVSFYAATIGTEQWIRLDDVVFRRTPGVPTNGTDCLEPSAPARAGAAAPVLERSEDRAWIPDGFTRRNGRARVAEPVWTATGSSAGSRTLRAAEPFDLRTAASARLRFESRLSRGVPGELQISLDGLEWRTLEWIGSSGTWQAVDIDLAGYVGQIVHIRFVLPLRTPGAESDRGGWSLRAIGVDIQSAGRRPIAVR